ncbi:hypothetical protein BU26DRAFT_491547 [Trematosphaeria pertusa]|uniref:Uncharacterized protein n=1 Tax=Trematosphaeria pertusa TaxID=390896 RepID=A0A6A6I1M5_9PLEO|nr:uncharacterized protein BU26DRAFT_491547 [Trematosphaeria pertusa]KAF2244177.1 hypothetical protein BU26DRAFT_491547 [Trematosphaeria pertusa]
MQFLRPSTMLRASALRPALSKAPRAGLQVRFASQDYGSGEGNPAGENPQQQGKRPREELEHPGPPPPKVAQGKPGQETSQASSQSSSQGSSQGTSATGSKSTNDSGGDSKPSEGSSSPSGQRSSGKGVKGAQPKILSDNPPGEKDESVRQHNEEMDHRAEKAYEQVSNKDAAKDKAPPGYWSGHGGRDKQP